MSGGYNDGPMSLLQEAAETPRLGEPNWFEKRREAYPEPEAAQQDATCVSLDLALLEGSPAKALDGFVPPEAELLPVSPRAIGDPPPTPLRRFSGKKVTPANEKTWLTGPDNRTVYRDTAVPWVWVGQIRNDMGGRASGCLIGERFILTAAHAIYPYFTPGQPMRPGIAFWPAMFDDQSALGSTWSANVIGATAWKVVGLGTVVGYDMAICLLDRPLGKWLGSFGAQGYNDDWEDLASFTHAGYPYDLGKWTRPCYQNGISVKDDDNDKYGTLELETNADIASGQSGGPLWGVFDGDHRVIGTLSGHQDHFLEPENACFAGGNALVRLVEWGRANW